MLYARCIVSDVLLTCPRLQAEKAAEEEAAAARAAASGPACPPTAVLGFAPASQTSGKAHSTTGKHSWLADLFASHHKKRKTAAQSSSEDGSETSGAHQDSRDHGAVNGALDAAVSSHVTESEEGAGEGGRDYGAAWRVAAQSSPAQPSPPPEESGALPSFGVYFLSAFCATISYSSFCSW